MKTQLPAGWRTLQPHELVRADDRVDFNPCASLDLRFELSVVMDGAWEGQPAQAVADDYPSPADLPVVFRFGDLAVEGGEEAYDELVALAQTWADPEGELEGPFSPVEQEATQLFLDTGDLRNIQDLQEQDEIVALFILLFAAAKRVGDI